MTEYGSVSAIGSYCQGARQLRRAARNVVSGPLDWVFADRLAILACIENDFDGLCAWDNLVIAADLTRLQDRVFGVDFFTNFRVIRKAACRFTACVRHATITSQD